MNKENIRWDKRMAFAVLSILNETYDGKMSRRGLLEAVEMEMGYIIPEAMKKKTRTTDHLKWEVGLRFYCQKFVKADFLRMHKGTWTLTRQGAEALTEGEDVVIAKADEAYANFQRKKKWLKQQEDNGFLDANLGSGGDVGTGSGGDVSTGSGGDVSTGGGGDVSTGGGGDVSTGGGGDVSTGSGDDVSTGSGDDSDEGDIPSDPESDARDEIEEYILSLDWIYFQELCAALLRGMGYHVSYVSPPGPDGGVDVFAGKDPLSSGPPRIKLQAKRQKSDVSLKVITDLARALKEGDVGIVVSASGFSASCRGVASNYPGNHIELIDITRFVDLWRQHYDNLSEEDKSLLPLQKVYFLNKKGIEKES